MAPPIQQEKFDGTEPSSMDISRAPNPDDEWQPLAWTTSICAIFLVVGLLGLKTRPIREPAPDQSVKIVPVVFTARELPQKPTPVRLTTAPSQSSASSPTVAVVAAAEPAQVAFPVPVESPVTIVAPRFALAPPFEIRASAPVATEFNADSATHGFFPKPKYPASELAAHHQGRVMLTIVVSTEGKPQSVEIKESSGWPKLDSVAAEKVRKDWDFGPGPVRYFYVPVVFQIK
jgi:protein TonB